MLPDAKGRVSSGLLEEEETFFGAHYLFVQAFAKHAIIVRVLVATHWKQGWRSVRRGQMHMWNSANLCLLTSCCSIG